MAQLNNPNTPNKSELDKVNDNIKEATSIEKKPTIVTPESAAILLRNDVLQYCIDDWGMPKTRNLIHMQAEEVVKNFTSEQKIEFSKELRKQFERARQFMEASHQEVIALTSQIGW